MTCKLLPIFSFFYLFPMIVTDVDIEASTGPSSIISPHVPTLVMNALTQNETEEISVHSRISTEEDEFFIEEKAILVRQFLDQHARDGTPYRRCINQALSESSSESDASVHRPRSLSKTKFDELLAILGTAANKLEKETEKQKKNNKKLKMATLGGTCFGAFCASLITGVVVSVITYLSSTM